METLFRQQLSLFSQEIVARLAQQIPGFQAPALRFVQNAEDLAPGRRAADGHLEMNLAALSQIHFSQARHALASLLVEGYVDAEQSPAAFAQHVRVALGMEVPTPALVAERVSESAAVTAPAARRL